MKIYSIEVMTELGRRVVELTAPIEVEPSGAMAPPFRSLTECLWGVLCQVTAMGSELFPPKVEA